MIRLQFNGRPRAIFVSSLTLLHSARGLASLARDGSGAGIREVARAWGRTMVEQSGIELRVEGLQRDFFEQPFILMANHASHLDIPILLAALPRCPGFLAKKELFDLPIFGPAMRGIECIPIDRSDRKQSLEAIDRAAAQLRAGGRLVVFPEGTRGDGKRLQALKKGPFHLVQRARVPLLPVGIAGSSAVCARDDFRVYPGPVTVRFGQPIFFSPERPKSLGRERKWLMDQVSSALSELSGLPREPMDAGID